MLLMALVLGLGYFKWGASLQATLVAYDSHTTSAKTSGLMDAGVLGGTIAYLKRVWIALTFGVLLGATLRVVVSPTSIARWFGGRGAASVLRGAIVGAPLFLCSCCVTPIFSSLHKRGARLGPNLSVLFAAPGLNVAALAVTLFLFPLSTFLLRLIAALLLVFGLAPLVGKVFEAERRASGQSETCSVEPEAPLTLRSFPKVWFKSVFYVAGMALPVLVTGVALSAFLLPRVQGISTGGPLLTILLVSLVATLVALPTFVEVPIALSMLAAGASPGVALAVLVAGPVINLPSLLVLAREVSVRAAFAVFVGVWLLAAGVGMIIGG
jgi:hypothetical protein